jgi:large repetitive protein
VKSRCSIARWRQRGERDREEMIEIGTIRIRRVHLPSIAAGVLAVLALSAGQAEANHVSCGDEITADTTLDSDLVNCLSNGIVIGADDITLDLNGHRVDGDGKPFEACPKEEFCDVGLLNDSHDGVTVSHGSVREFDVGVFVGRARHNRVLDISSSRNPFFGIVVAESARSLIRNSSFNRNPGPDGDGMGLFGSHRIRILGNSFRRNELGVHVDSSTQISFKRNLISRNPAAVIVEGGRRNQISDNRLTRNDVGLILLGNENTVARNRIINTSDLGISLENGRGNLITGNRVRDAGVVGIGLRSFEEDQHLRDNVVRRNRVHGAGEHGFFVGPGVKNTLLKGNHVSRARKHGFNVKSAATTLTRNHARRNGDLGIRAVQGVTDGGGNRASGNGDPDQCTHVACD